MAPFPGPWPLVGGPPGLVLGRFLALFRPFWTSFWASGVAALRARLAANLGPRGPKGAPEPRGPFWAIFGWFLAASGGQTRTAAPWAPSGPKGPRRGPLGPKRALFGPTGCPPGPPFWPFWALFSAFFGPFIGRLGASRGPLRGPRLAPSQKWRPSPLPGPPRDALFAHSFGPWGPGGPQTRTNPLVL